MNILEAELSELNVWFPQWKAEEHNIIWKYGTAGDVYLEKHTYQHSDSSNRVNFYEYITIHHIIQRESVYHLQNICYSKD